MRIFGVLKMGMIDRGRDAMLEWYLEVNALFRAMHQKAIDAQGLLAGDDKVGAKLINGYLKADYQLLRKLWTGAGRAYCLLGEKLA